MVGNHCGYGVRVPLSYSIAIYAPSPPWSGPQNCRWVTLEIDSSRLLDLQCLSGLSQWETEDNKVRLLSLHLPGASPRLWL